MRRKLVKLSRPPWILCRSFWIVDKAEIAAWDLLDIFGVAEECKRK